MGQQLAREELECGPTGGVDHGVDLSTWTGKDCS